MSRIKVAVVSAVWRRPEVFELFARGMKEMNKESACELKVIIAGSEGERSRKMVEKHGFDYLEKPNEPLATKVNATTLAAKQWNPDYVLCLGSDDIISPKAWAVYERYMKEGFDFIGVSDFFFWDTVTKKALYWAGYREKYRKGHTCGAGRILSRRLMELWQWQPWEVKDSKLLDNSMQYKLERTRHSSCVFSLLEEQVFAVDVKSSTNMTPFKVWDNTCEIEPEIIKKQFPYLCAV